jgi:hypothetical protein
VHEALSQFTDASLRSLVDKVLTVVMAAGVRCCPGTGRGCDCNGGIPLPTGERLRDRHDPDCRSLGAPLCSKCGDTGYLGRIV